MTKRSGLLVRLLNVLLCATFAAQADTTDSLIQRVEQRYNNARTLSVNFVENYSMQGHLRQPESGTLTLRKIGKMRWDYVQPKGKLFISDGKSVYLYTAQDNRVEKWKLKDTEDMRAPLAFLLGKMDMKREFRDFQMHTGDGGTWLDASAKNDRVPYERLQMLIAPDSSILQLKVVGRDQSVLSFTFDGERLNAPVGDEVFHFTIPPGAEVVDSVSVGTQGQ
jgi:outer membrane lipoprotein carrier protein